MKRQQWFAFVPVTLATAGLTACASVLGGEQVKIRPVDTMQTLTGAPRDALYESAVSAINERDYGRALEYLQAAKAKDPRNVKALNALGVVYDKLGRFDLSARYYAQARAIEPDSRIVAENMGYSKVLQRLLNPNQPVAVATIDLPPGLINPAPAPSDKAVVTAALAPSQPLLPVREKRVIDTPPLSMTAMPVALPDAKQVLAALSLPQPPVTERKLIDTPPPTVTAMPVELPDAKYIFADVTLAEPVMSVTEKKIIDAPPPAVTAASFALPDAKPLFAASAAVLSLPVPGAEHVAPAEPVTSAAIIAAAGPVSPAPRALVIAAVERKVRFEFARPAIPVAAPALAAVSISLPQAEAGTASVPAVLAVAKPIPVAPRPVAKRAAEKKAMVASVAPALEKPIASAAVAAGPAVPARPVVSAMPVKQAAAKATPAKGKVLTIGQPIKLVDASGKPGGAGTILRRLTSLGWTMRPADSRSQPATVLFYPVQNLAAAKAMQRTLPFPVRLIADSGKATGMRLVIGRDYLAWKPRNSRIAVLWQKRMVVASSQKPSLRGVR